MCKGVINESVQIIIIIGVVLGVDRLYFLPFLVTPLENKSTWKKKTAIFM